MIKPEYDHVPPKAELKQIDEATKVTMERKQQLTKQLNDLKKLPTYTLKVSLHNDDDVPVPIKGADGKYYDAVVLPNVSGANIKSMMTMATIGIQGSIPDEENLRVRIGGELARCDTAIRLYQERAAKVNNQLEAQARKAQGGRG